jgi:hypothetical protein
VDLMQFGQDLFDHGSVGQGLFDRVRERGFPVSARGFGVAQGRVNTSEPDAYSQGGEPVSGAVVHRQGGLADRDRLLEQAGGQMRFENGGVRPVVSGRPRWRPTNSTTCETSTVRRISSRSKRMPGPSCSPR